MNRIRSSIAIAVLVVAGSACKKDKAKEAAAAAAKAAPAPAAAAPVEPAPTPTAEPAAAAEPGPTKAADSPCTATPTGKLAESTEGDTLVEFKMKNTSAKPWHYCNVYVFAYDKAGKVIGRGSLSANGQIKPGAEQTTSIRAKDDKDKPLVDPTNAVYELVVSDVYFDDKTEWKEKVDFFGHAKPTNPTVAIQK